MVGERQRLIDTTMIIIFYHWATFYVVIVRGQSGGRSQAGRRTKEGERGGGETRQRDDGLIEWIQMSIFSEEVGRDRSSQERNEREREERGRESMENETEETERLSSKQKRKKERKR